MVIVTRSVGCGPGVWLSGHEEAGGLVLISPFTSAFAVRIPWPIFPGDRFPNLKTIRQSKTPLLVIHGTADTLITPSHGRQLVAASASSDKTFLPIPGAGHNDIFQIASPQITQAIGDFSRKVGELAVHLPPRPQ